MPGRLATISLLVAVLEALLEGRRVDDVGDAVAVTMLQVFEVEADCFANVRQGEGDDLCVEIQTGAVMSVGRSRADSPERWRAPLADHAAVKLHLVEIRSNVVVLEVAVDTAHRVSAAPRQPALRLAFALGRDG